MNLITTSMYKIFYNVHLLFWLQLFHSENVLNEENHPHFNHCNIVALITISHRYDDSFKRFFQDKGFPQ